MREYHKKRILTFFGAVFLVLFVLVPFGWMVIISLTTSPDFLVTKETVFTLKSYQEVLTDRSLHFVHYLRNSLVVSLLTAVAVSLITVVGAYVFTRMDFWGKIAIPVLILGLSMFPQISIIGFLFNLFTSLGIINTYIALLLPYIAWTCPLALWINISYFRQIPTQIDKAALVDGAGRLKTIFRIVFPLALPGIFSSFLLVFIAAFNEFLFALMMTIDHQAQTLPVGIALFQGLHGEVPWNNIMAASAVASVPLILLTLFFQRYVVQGLTGGSLKA